MAGTFSKGLLVASSKEDLALLDVLAATCQSLKQKNMTYEAAACMEQSLWLKKKLFGIESETVRSMCKDVVQTWNSLAMESLNKNNFKGTLELLKKAETLTDPTKFIRHDSVRILTFNNFACCYRRYLFLSFPWLLMIFAFPWRSTMTPKPHNFR
jgi:hypothetical protein